MSCLFPNYEDVIPKSRPDLVNDLEIPEDITLEPLSLDMEETMSLRSDSLVSGSLSFDCDEASTDSSLALSRAMTDSDIDYERYYRLKNRNMADPWAEMRAALHAFPPDYLSCLTSYITNDDLLKDLETSEQLPKDLETGIGYRRLYFDDQAREEMERFFEEECTVFSPDDPGLLALEDALKSMKISDIDFDDF